MKNQFTSKLRWAFVLSAFICLNTSVWADTEPNDVIDEANALALNTVQNGDLFTNPASDTNDWYEVSVPADGLITVTGSFNLGLTGYVYIHGGDGTQLVWTNVNGNAYSVSQNCIGSGTVYVRVNRSGGSGTYTLEVNSDSPANALDMEPNNVIAEIQNTYEENEAWTGHLGYSHNGTVDAHDYFNIVSPHNGNVTLEATFDEGLSGYIYLHQKDGTQLGFVYISGATGSYTATCQAGDTLIAQIYRTGGCGSYTTSFSTSDLANTNDMEPNSGLTTLTSIDAIQNTYEENEVWTGQLGYDDVDTGLDNYDYFFIVSPRDGNVMLTTSYDEGLAGYIYLYEKDGTQIGFTYINGETDSFTANCYAADTLVAVIYRSSGCGSYTSSFSTLGLTYEEDMEPNHDVSVSLSIEAIQVTLEENEEWEGHLGYQDADLGRDLDDYYYILSPQDGNVTLTVEYDPGMAGYIYLYEKDGSQIGFTYINGASGTYTANCYASDTLVARINRTSGCGSYIASFGTSELIYENDEEPNDSFETAIVSANHEMNEGHLGYEDSDSGIDSDDWYQISVVDVPFDLEAKLVKGEEFAGYIYFHDGGGSTINWTYHGGQLEVAHTTTITESGTYYIRVSRSGGCGSYTLGNFCANAPEITASIDGSNELCPGESVMLSATEGLDSYSWRVNNNEVGTGQTYEASGPGDYYVVGYDGNSCGGESNHIPISQFGVSPLAVSVVGNSTICEGQTTTLNATDGFLSYLWDNGETTQSIEVSESGIYTVEGTTADGCVVESDNSAEITVLPDSDDDGVCDEDDNCPNTPGEIGDPCDDGDENTSNDTVGTDCICAGTSGTPENTPLACADGVDNDGDGLSDCEDPECQALSAGCSTCFSDGSSFADVVLDYNNTCPNNIWTDPTAALGVPNYAADGGSAHATLGEGGHIALEFTDNTLINSGNDDPDLFVFEVGPLVEGSTIELRPLNLETENQLMDAGLLDTDNDGFYEFGAISGATAVVDIDAFFDNLPAASVFFDAIKITDIPGGCSGTSPGADIDGVCALSSLPCDIGSACDDGDPLTENDAINANCQCEGTPIASTSILTLACGGEVIQITGAVEGANGGGTATAETRTIYAFAPDAGGDVPTYVGGAWPYVIIPGGILSDPDITAVLTTNADGVLLVNGWPAYQFVGDLGADDANGPAGPWSYFLLNGDQSQDACPPVWDCPAEEANYGDACDDGNDMTENDEYGTDCICAGTPIITWDCPDLEVNYGDACDDGNDMTENDEYGTDCICAGTPIITWDCPDLEVNYGDACDDGNDMTENDEYDTDCICAGTPIIVWDCPDLEANYGDECDDGNDMTENDEYGTDCICAGTPIIIWDCPDLEVNYGDACDDGNDMTENDEYGTDCICAGTAIITWDCPDLEVNYGDACDDGNDMTENDEYDTDCICAGTPIIVWDCPDLEANYGDECDDGNDDLIPGIVNENCECEEQFDCPALGANIGNSCDDGNPDTSNDVINANCECIGEPIIPSDCEDWVYFMNDNEGGESDIYGVDISTGDAVLTYITTVDFHAHIAYNSVDGLIYVVNNSTGYYVTVDPITAFVSAPVDLNMEIPSITTAVFNLDGNKLLVGSASLDKIYSINIVDASVSEFDGYAPISGGDIAFDSEGKLYLATRSGNILYEVGLEGVEDDHFLDNIKNLVTGMALTDTDQLLTSHNGNSDLHLYNSTDGSYTDTSFPLMLDGMPFTHHNGDLASGCEAPENTQGDCDLFSTFYADINRPGVSGTDIYGVIFTEGGDAIMTFITNVNFNAHIAFNAEDNILYLLNGNGSFVQAYDLTLDVFSTELPITDGPSGTPAVVYNPEDGLLYIGAASEDAIYSVDLVSGVASFVADAPVHGGDLALQDGSLYLATYTGSKLYLISGGVALEVGSIPAQVNGMAQANNSTDFVMANKDAGVFTQISSTDGSTVNTYIPMIDGDAVTLYDGDMAAGCSDNNPEEVPEGECNATEILDYIEGTTMGGGSISVSRTDASQAIGAPERTDELVFVSLGHGGSLAVGFGGMVPNEEGDDIEIVETSFSSAGCAAYPEYADVYVSMDGTDWFLAATGVCKSEPFVDISDAGDFDYVMYVMVVNSTDGSTTSSDGFDVDGIVALHNCEDDESGGEAIELVASTSVMTSYPNPTSGPSQVVFTTAETGRTLVEVYDMNGRHVQTLFNQVAQESREYRLDFNGSDLPNGVYIHKMTTNKETIVEKFMIAK